jgi:hypothetical protein
MPDDIPAIDEMPVALRVTDEQISAARRGVLWRYQHGKLTAEEAHDALAALGLITYEGDGRASTRAPRGPRTHR